MRENRNDRHYGQTSTGEQNRDSHSTQDGMRRSNMSMGQSSEEEEEYTSDDMDDMDDTEELDDMDDDEMISRAEDEEDDLMNRDENPSMDQWESQGSRFGSGSTQNR